MHERSTTERWLPVFGYAGSYEVSDHGRVRSLDRLRSDGHHVVRGQVLRPTLAQRTGYHFVTLCSPTGEKSLRSIHSLVLEAFVGPRPPGAQCCHHDGDRTNNHASNLRWDSCAANLSDRVRHGTDPTGERNPAALLTEAAVLDIRRRLAAGATKAATARAFGVAETTVHDIAKRRTWSHL